MEHCSRILLLGVVFTTLVFGEFVWLAGLSIPAAFVIGAVFAQASTTVIASLHLGETALGMLRVPPEEIERVLQEVRDWGYASVLEPDSEKPQLRA